MGDAEQGLKPLKIQPRAWSQREFLQTIVSRYFICGSEVPGGFYSWDVSPIEGSAHTAIVELQNHLSKLGWNASLRNGEPYYLTIHAERNDQLEFSRPAQYFFWVLGFLFFWTIGVGWMRLHNPSLSWHDSAILEPAFASFALPLSGALMLASSIRRRFFARMGLRVGAALPVVAPIMVHSTGGVVWPFGLLALLNQTSLEELPWPDRNKLAQASLVMPLSMMVIGLIYTLGGLLLTPSTAPLFDAAPVVLQLNPISQLFAGLFLPQNEMVLRSAWLHPLALAGQTLMVFGWILLIPIPGLPGHRILIALVGSEDMIDPNFELIQYALLLGAVIYVLLTSGFMPWVVLFAVGAWRLFSTDAVGLLPMMVDEVKPLSKSVRAQTSLALFCALLLAFPGMSAVSEFEGWDDGLELDWSEQESYDVGESFSIPLELDLVGVQARAVSVSAWLDPPRESWNLSIDCGAGGQQLPARCSAGEISPLNSGLVSVNGEMPNQTGEQVPSTLFLLVDDGGEIRSHTISIVPENGIVPTSAHWDLRPDFDGLTACANLTVSSLSLSGNLSTSVPLWDLVKPVGGTFDGGVGEFEVCLSAPAHSRIILEKDRWGEVLPLVLTLDDGERHEWPLRISSTSATLPVPSDGWVLAGKMEQTPAWLQTGSHVAGGEGSLTCTESSLREPSLIDGYATWRPQFQTEVRIPDSNADILVYLELQSGEVVSSCDSSAIPPVLQNWSLASGPAMAIVTDGEVRWGWADVSLELGEHEVLNLGNETLSISVEYEGGLDANSLWSAPAGVTLGVGESALLNLSPLGDSSAVRQAAWFSLQGGNATLNLGAWCTVGSADDGCGGAI